MITLQQYANILMENRIVEPPGTCFPNIYDALELIQETEEKSAQITRPFEMNSKTMAEALAFYSGLGSKIMNGHYKYGGQIQLNIYISECIRVLDYFCNVGVYSGGRTLYHGRTTDSIIRRFGYGWNDLWRLVGKRVIISDGFISTASKRNIAECFSDQNDYPAIWRIKCTHAFNALHRTVGNFSDEDEYILPPNTVVVIRNLKFIDGRCIIDAELVGKAVNNKIISPQENSAYYIQRYATEKRNIQIAQKDNVRFNRQSTASPRQPQPQPVSLNGARDRSSNASYDKKKAILDGLCNKVADIITNKVGIPARPQDSRNNSNTYVNISRYIETPAYFEDAPLHIELTMEGIEPTKYNFIFALVDDKHQRSGYTKFITIDTRIQNELVIIRDFLMNQLRVVKSFKLQKVICEPAMNT